MLRPADLFPAARRRTLLAAALAVTVPVFLLTNERFAPVEAALSLDGAIASAAFTLAAAEPLVLESEYAVRTTDGQAGQAPDGVGLRLTLNGTTVAELAVPRLFAVERAMPVAPADATRAGANSIDITVDGPPGLAAAVTMRVHNYVGINLRFPRVFVVPDAAVTHFFATVSPLRHLAVLVAAVLFGLITVAVIARLAPGSLLLLLAPASLLWGTLLYGILTPQYVWLSPGAVPVVTLTPALLAGGGLWLHARRRAVALAATVTLIALLLCEVGLRLFNVVMPSPVFFTDSYSRFRGQPGARLFDTALNSRGFNDVETSVARPAAVDYRIVALGDSVAFGVVPYADNYLTLLESRLDPQGGVEVVNMGVPGVTPRDYLALLVAEGLAYDPDLVLVSVFIGNDFDRPARALYERSYLVTATYFFWTLFTSGAPADTMFEGSAPTYADDAPTFAPDRFLEIEVERAPIFDPDAAGFDDALAGVVADLERMRDLAARAGAGLLVVLVPAEVQVDDVLAAQVERAAGAGPLDFERPSRELAAALQRADVDVLDLLPAFRDAASSQRLYKPRDTHWNRAGNRLAADTIAPAIRARMEGSE